MNVNYPQGASSGVQRYETRGGERTEAKSSPANLTGKQLPQEEKNGPKVDTAVKASETRDQLVKAVARLNDYVQTVQRDLLFTLDEASGKAVISVIDRQSLEVIRQIPAEITLTLAQKLNNEEPLYLFSAQV